MKQDEFWDKRSEKYDGNIRKESFYEKTIEKTNSLLSDTDVVLDFACATGEMSLDLAEKVKYVHGIDTSGKMIEKAKQKAQDRNIENVQFSQADVNDHNLENNSFSKVLAFNILHLVDNASKKLDRVHNLLSDGGLLISETPCLGERGWIVRSLIIFAQKIGLAPPILNLTYNKLESLISCNNFEIIENEVLDANSKIYWVVAKKKWG